VTVSTQEIQALTSIRGVLFPEGVRYRQLIFVGPPGSGKSTIVSKIKGWPAEGYLDLTKPWWRDTQLSYRPREVHLGFPVEGREESLALFEEQRPWAPARVDPSRIRIPPRRRWFFQADWRRRLVFDVQLPPVEALYAIRRERARRGTHPIDEGVTIEQVRAQVDAYAAFAYRLQRAGLLVHVRTGFDAPPRRVFAQVDDAA